MRAVLLLLLLSVTQVRAEEDDDPNAHLIFAESALQTGQFNVAAREYLRAARLSSDEKLAGQATRMAFETRQDSLAGQAARLWMELNPSDLDARRYLALASLRVWDRDEAVRQFERLLMIAFKTPAEGFLDVATGLNREENSYAVLRLVQALAGRFPPLAESHYAIGVNALRAYDYALAVHSAREALRLKSPFPAATQLLSRALVVADQPEEGLAIARAAGDSPQARLNLALLLAGAKQGDAARTALEALLDVPEARPEALVTLASFNMASGRLDEAVRQFTQVQTTGRHVNLAFYSLGVIYERQREDQRALHFYSRVSGGEQAVQARLRAARLLVNHGARDQAEQLLERFVRENPAADSEIAVGRAQLLMDEGATDAALETIEAAQHRYPDSEALHFTHSVMLERAQRSGEAVAELRAALERRPEDPIALNALGYMLAEHKRGVREAEMLVRKALEKMPDNPAVQDSLGWVLHRQGKQQEALKLLSKAYAGLQNAEIAAHLGEVYWALGQTAKARELWQAALTANPNDRYLQSTVDRHLD